MSVISFLLILSEMKKSKVISKYNNHKGLNNRIKNFQVSLGMGLHLGYAIEGAIGSYYKIDASYLSQNVRITEKLEELTKTYKVPMILSEPLFQHCTEKTKSHCRYLDNYKLPFSDDSIKLYTIDTDLTHIQVEENTTAPTMKQVKIKRIHQRMMRNKLREDSFSNKK